MKIARTKLKNFFVQQRYKFFENITKNDFK